MKAIITIKNNPAKSAILINIYKLFINYANNIYSAETDWLI